MNNIKKNENNDAINGELFEEIIIPKRIKPFINKEINFKFFIDLLTEKVDKMRVKISLKEF